MEAFLSKLPYTLARSSELLRANDFVVLKLNLQSVLLSRGSYGVVRAFLNVCLHWRMKPGH